MPYRSFAVLPLLASFLTGTWSSPASAAAVRGVPSGQPAARGVELGAAMPLSPDAEISSRLAGKLLLLVGPPGAGKGTQAEIFKERFGMQLLSTGDLIREEIRRGTPDGKVLEEHVGQGRLAPREIVNRLVADFVASADPVKGILLDGFPRNLDNLRDLETLLSPLGKSLDAAFYLDLTEDEAVRRLQDRRICEGCRKIYNLTSKPPKSSGVCDDCGAAVIQRDDDKPEVIRNRFREFQAQTAPLIAELKRLNLLHPVPALATPQQTTDRILQILK